MKKTLTILLTAMLLISMTACSFQVPDPMQYPDYTISNETDTMELRMTAVQAMHDLLSIQWCTETEIVYRKTGPVSNKQFVHKPNNIYAGLLYTNASTGLFQFLEFYDHETGCLRHGGTSDDLKKDIGSSCADSLLWAWSTVSNSFTGGYYPVLMVAANGYYPVGDYVYNTSIGSYNEMPSYSIIDQNDKAVIMEAYAQILPADALVTTSDNHAMMAIEEAVVSYLPDGSIDSANSYVMIQDQRAGGETFYKSEVDGHTLNYSGRTSAKYTFDALYEEDFLPVTTAEFLGLKEYEKAEVSLEIGQCNSAQDLSKEVIHSNYPLAVCNLIAVDQEGNETVIDRVLFNAAASQGVPRSYDLRNMDGIQNLTSSEFYTSGTTIKLEVVVSTGERFIPISFTI